MQNLNKGDCLHTTDKPHKRYKRTVLKKEKKTKTIQNWNMFSTDSFYKGKKAAEDIAFL